MKSVLPASTFSKGKSPVYARGRIAGPVKATSSPMFAPCGWNSRGMNEMPVRSSRSNASNG
nr:hypothetical protein [Fodinicola feengrottensis]